MTEEKGSITISVPSNTTLDEIKNIRQQFKKSKYSNEYKLNILISGTENTVENLGSLLVAYAKKYCKPITFALQ